MPVNQNKQVKKDKIKMFFFFLFIATFIWVLTKFSREFTATVEASLLFESLPENTIIANNYDNDITFDLTANGFGFLYLKIKKPIIKINVSNYSKKGELVVKISDTELKKIISNQLNSKILIKNLSITDLKIYLDALNTRIIPIKLVSDIHYKNGFKNVGDLQVIPNFITVSGPSTIIDSIVSIETKPIKLKNVDSDIKKSIELDLPNIKEVSFSPKKVDLIGTVKEFTQKSLVLPIETINLPNDITLKLIPNSTSIKFDVSIDKYNIFTEEDFTLVCDYQKRNEEENFMIPEITEQPLEIQHVEIHDKIINYLLFK